MFVVVAQWTAQAGKEDLVDAILREVTPISRAEPGCLMFVVHRSLDEPRRFVLYEQFRDRAAFDAHCRTESFTQNILGRAVPLLEHRERVFCTPL
jgi:(4S)-4-hydroxy-5-phosphonooxypentane-2,3-dione isomerase